MTQNEIHQLTMLQRQYFFSGATLELSARMDALTRLKETIRKYEDEIHAALKQDLGNSPVEGYMC